MPTATPTITPLRQTTLNSFGRSREHDTGARLMGPLGAFLKHFFFWMVLTSSRGLLENCGLPHHLPPPPPSPAAIWLSRGCPSDPPNPVFRNSGPCDWPPPHSIHAYAEEASRGTLIWISDAIQTVGISTLRTIRPTGRLAETSMVYTHLHW